MNDDDTPSLAAEYVLGTLDSEERTRAQVLLDVDGGFRGMVRIWERRLGELHLMVEPVEPAALIWDRIKGKLPNVEQSKETVVTTLPEPPKSGEEAPKEFDFDLDLGEDQRSADSIEKAPPGSEPPSPMMTPPRVPAESTQTLARIASRLEDPDIIPRRPEPPHARHAKRGSGAWMALGLVMTLMVVALGGLMAAWRFVPERLPPQLRATTILHIPTVTTRPPAPPGSEFDE